MLKPSLSVMMPNYNHARFLPHALGAILAQSYRPHEIVVLDDGSTDDSVELIEAIRRAHPRVALVRSERNRGALWVVSRLLEIATGDYVYVPSSDDVILPGFLERSMSLLAEHPQAGLCSTLSRVIGERGEDRGVLPGVLASPRRTFLPPEAARNLLLSVGTWVQGNTAIYRRQALIDAGGYIPELRSFCDGFIAQVLALRHGACFIPEPLAAWRQMDNTYSATLAGDVRAQRDIWNTAVQLMRTRYRDVFPTAYPALWEREAIFDWGRAASGRVWSQQRRFLAEQRLADPNPGMWRNFFARAVGVGMWAQLAWTSACLSLAYIPRRAVRRQLHTAFMRWRYPHLRRLRTKAPAITAATGVAAVIAGEWTAAPGAP